MGRRLGPIEELEEGTGTGERVGKRLQTLVAGMYRPFFLFCLVFELLLDEHDLCYDALLPAPLHLFPSHFILSFLRPRFYSLFGTAVATPPIASFSVCARLEN